MSRPMIRGWFTVIPSWRGQDGIPIRESGLVDRISPSELVSELAGTEVLDGDGIIGAAIGITITRFTTTTGTTRVAGRFTTATPITAVEVCAADSMGATPRIGLRTPAGTEEFLTVPVEPPSLLKETPMLLGDTPHPTAR